jgi:hypothetical protein
VSADRRHPLRRIGRPNRKSPSLCHPSWLFSGRNARVGADEKNAMPARELGSVSKGIVNLGGGAVAGMVGGSVG